MFKKEIPDIIEYNEDLQKLLLRYLISSNTAFVRCQNILKPTYWNDRLRSTARYILTFAEEYNSLPTPDQIAAKTNLKLDLIENAELHADWFLDSIEEFCRHKAMEALIYDGPQLLEKGEYAELERRSKENMLITLQTELGTNYFLNPLERLHKMRDRTGMTSTGWKDIDEKLYGGFNRGELSFFLGLPGSGKSLFLQNLALNWVQMGLNVVYITLELSEELVGLRFDAMITSMATKQIFKDMDQVALKLGAIYRSGTNGVKWGQLQIKKLNGAGTKVNDIRAFLKEYEIQSGIRPDAICVDYLDLLHPNSGKVGPADLFVKDKYTSEELRSLASEWNILACTAAQLNRSGVQEQDFDVSHVAGGISKINTADNVMAIFSSSSMRERGEYQIQFLKTRSSSGVGSKIYLAYDVLSLRITNAIETIGDRGSISSIQQQLSAKKVNSKIVESPSSTPAPYATSSARDKIRALAAAASNN